MKKIIDEEKEIQKKVYKNSKREYKVINGVNTRIKEFEEKLKNDISDKKLLQKKLKHSTFVI